MNLGALVMAGLVTTSGLGESGVAPQAQVELGVGRLRVEAVWSGANKVESGAGWLARGAAEVRFGPVGIGAAYSHRDGGGWTKSYPWVRASVGSPDVRLIVERAVGGYNRETKGELRAYLRRGALVVGYGVFVQHHLQGVGYGVSVGVGIGGGVWE